MIVETILGVVTGIGGSLVTGIMNYKTQKLKNEHDLAIIRAETDAMVAEANANIQITQAQVEGEIEIADSKAYAISQHEGNKDALKEAYVVRLFETQGWFRFFTVPAAALLVVLLGLVDIFRKMMRPGITAYLAGVTTWITYKAWIVLETTKSGANALTATQAMAIFTNVTNTVVYLTVSCVTWWFGDRRMAKFLMKMK
uniref:Uncharacterized protein n=1 Tax=viral metagenome TaxID=1070528 RepID=A0A6M3J1Q6_9ZZZZ